MARPTTYDADFYAWSQEQASVLRDLAKSRRDLSNQLDLEHVAEEIEDVGRAELNSVQGCIRQILVHLIKAASAPDAAAVAHWRKEVVTFHNDLLDRYSPAMRQRIDLDTQWRRAAREAEAALAVHGQDVPPCLPADCPFELDELVAEAFEFQAAVETIERRIAGARGPE